MMINMLLIHKYNLPYDIIVESIIIFMIIIEQLNLVVETKTTCYSETSMLYLTNKTSVEINVKDYLIAFKDPNTQIPKNITLNISYRPMLFSILYVLDESYICNPFNLKQLSNYRVGNEEILRDKCNQIINTFGNHDESIFDDTNITLVNKYCNGDVTSIDLYKTNLDKPPKINDLLPSIPYSFNITTSPILMESVIESICTNESIPMYPPQTDLGSFVIQTDQNSLINRKNRTVLLYWRTVPLFFTGSRESNYKITCFKDTSDIDINKTTMTMNDIVFERSDFSRKNGMLDIKVATNENYRCDLYTNNTIGLSVNKSTILIPKDESIIYIDYDEFSFYVTAVAEHYMLRWDNITSISNGMITSISDGIYTIYWCLTESPYETCTSIDGMVKTRKLSTTITIKGYVRENVMFGLSFKTDDNRNFTGIHWAKCVSNIKTEKLPLVISSAQPTFNHTTLKIEWDFEVCRSLIADIHYYEITYCQMYPVDPCLSTVEHTHITSEYNFTAGLAAKNCTELNITNDLIMFRDIENLSYSTYYAIRIKPILISGGEIDWSKTFYAVTGSDPKDCKTNPIYYVVIITCLFIIFIFYQFISRGWVLINKFRNTKTKLPKRLESVNHIKEDVLSCDELKQIQNRCDSTSESSSDLNDNNEQIVIKSTRENPIPQDLNLISYSDNSNHDSNSNTTTNDINSNINDNNNNNNDNSVISLINEDQDYVPYNQFNLNYNYDNEQQFQDENKSDYSGDNSSDYGGKSSNIDDKSTASRDAFLADIARDLVIKGSY